jgi:1-acyl-sn-glycerol-3-phosphate acyltransferase
MGEDERGKRFPAVFWPLSIVSYPFPIRNVMTTIIRRDRPDLVTVIHPERVVPRFRRRLAYALLDGLVRLLLDVRQEGEPHLPEGPLIIYYNHVHYADPAVVLALLRGRRYAVPIAKEEVLDLPLIGYFVRHFGVILVARGQADVEALRVARQVLENGHVLLIAPEGTRNRVDFTLQAARRGMAFLVWHTGAALLPVALVGTERFPATLWRGRRTPVTVRWGRPFRLHLPDGLSRREAQALIMDLAMRELAALLPEEKRGAYRALPPAAPSEWVQYV